MSLRPSASTPTTRLCRFSPKDRPAPGGCGPMYATIGPLAVAIHRLQPSSIRPLLVALETWLREQRAKLSGQSKVGKAIAYSLTRWVALTRFLDDSRLCMSNNAAEREIRPITVGRNNWTFAGSDQGPVFSSIA